MRDPDTSFFSSGLNFSINLSPVLPHMQAGQSQQLRSDKASAPRGMILRSLLKLTLSKLQRLRSLGRQVELLESNIKNCKAFPRVWRLFQRTVEPGVVAMSPLIPVLWRQRQEGTQGIHLEQDAAGRAPQKALNTQGHAGRVFEISHVS